MAIFVRELVDRCLDPNGFPEFVPRDRYPEPAYAAPFPTNMKRNHLLITLFAATIAACASTDQPADAGDGQMGMDMPPSGAMTLPQPTSEHQRLTESIGEWSGTMTMSIPGVPSDPMPCSETISAFGPFWITSEFRSDFVGVPFQGRATQGYDATRGKYVGTWIDSMSGFMSIMEGNFNEAGELVMEWEAPDMTGQLAPHRSVTKHDGDTVTMNFWTNDQPTMVIQMERQ